MAFSNSARIANEHRGGSGGFCKAYNFSNNKYASTPSNLGLRG